MTTPSIVSSQTWRNTLVTTSHGPITLPSSYAAGDLLLCIFSVDAAPTCTASTGWTRRVNAAYTTEVKQAIFTRTATGSDPQLTVTTSSSEMSSAITLVVRNTSSVSFSSAATGDSTNPNPPGLSMPTSVERLWLATVSHDRRVVATSAPSGYTSLITYQGASVEAASTSVAYRIATTSYEDPGSFAAVQEQWVSYTLACNPTSDVDYCWIAASGPLGVPAVQSALISQAQIALSGPLGASPALLLHQHAIVSARIATPGPLGDPALQFRTVHPLWIATPGPLGVPKLQLLSTVETDEDDMIIDVFRGAGTRPGGEIRDPLIGVENSTALARGRAELNKSAHDRMHVTLSMAYRGDLTLGGLVAVTDSVTAQTWVGQIVGIAHQINDAGAITTINVDRPL